MKKYFKITSVFISCLLLLTIPLSAAAQEGVPEDTGTLTAWEETWAEDASNAGELAEDAAEPAGDSQAEDADEPAQAVQDEEAGNDIQTGQDEGSGESALTEQTDQDGSNTIQEPASEYDIPFSEDAGTLPDEGQEAEKQELEDDGDEAVSGEGSGENDIPEGTADGTVPAETEQDPPADSLEEAEEVIDPETSGSCGEELFWEYSEGILSIYGSGEMYDYSYSEGVVPGWSAFSGLAEEIHIEEGVTLLDTDAFAGFTALEVICYNGPADSWASVMLSGEEVLAEESIFSLTEIRFAEQEEAAEETAEAEDGEEASDQEAEENVEQDPAEGQPEGDSPEGSPAEESTDEEQPDEGIPGEEFLADEEQPDEGIPAEEPAADEGQPDDGSLAADAGISDTGEQAVADTDDRTDPAEAAENEQDEVPSAEEKGEGPSAEGKPAADGSQPSAAAGENVQDSLLAAGEEEVAADEAAGQSQEAPLSITKQPEDVEAAAGETVSVHVEANRADATYQWQFSTNGTTWKICTSAGSSTDTFSFLMKDTLNGRMYRCAVTAGGTTLLSDAAAVSLQQQEGALSITEQPADAEAAAGETISLHVGANRADASYQWQFSTNGTTWKACTSAGSSTDTFSFLMKETLDGRKYRCAVTAGGTTAISSEATVRLPQQQGGLSITEQPQDVEAAGGETVSLHVGANTADASYQWQFSTNGTTWKACTSAGSNTDTFSFMMKETLDGRKYRCAVTGGGKTIISSEATVRLSQQGGLSITEQPRDVEAAAGESVSLHVGASVAEASYQWQFSADGAVWKACTSAGCNTDTFSFLMKDSLNGRKYRCAVTAGGKTLISSVATVSLSQQQEPLSITEQPEDVSAKAGGSVSLHVGANRTGVTYQWQFCADGTTWKNCTSAGCKTDTFSFLMKDTLDGRKYRCAVTGGGKTVLSDIATVTLAASQIIIEDVIYEMVDGKMTVTGHRGSRTSYTVQETVEGTTVTVIGEKAFENNTLIQQIHLPDTIQVIKKRAFAGCSSLTSMD